MFVHAHDPDYVPNPIYPEYIRLEDEHEFPAEEQPLPPVVSPTVELLGYVTESDPEEDPEEDVVMVRIGNDEDEVMRTRRVGGGALSDGELAILVSVVELMFSHLRDRAVIPPTLSRTLLLGLGLPDDIPESEQPPRKRLYLSTLGSRYEVRKSSTARPTKGRGIDYGFFSTIDAEER
ncbi:hypothetical protein Tco_0469868 [Tanacetum coccineum]